MDCRKGPIAIRESGRSGPGSFAVLRGCGRLEVTPFIRSGPFSIQDREEEGYGYQLWEAALKKQDQWKSFEPEVQTLAVFSSTKLPLERQTEFEGVISSFLFDITATKGPSDIGPQESELPQIPVPDSRAALMILFILLVHSHPDPFSFLMTVDTDDASARVMVLGQRMRFGR